MIPFLVNLDCSFACGINETRCSINSFTDYS